MYAIAMCVHHHHRFTAAHFFFVNTASPDCFNPAAPRTLRIASSKQYWIETTPMSHADAKANCIAHGGWLLDITDQNELDAIILLLQGMFNMKVDTKFL